jgi:hypothetical protein
MKWENTRRNEWRLNIFLTFGVVIRRTAPDYYSISVFGEFHPDGASDLALAKELALEAADQKLQSILADIAHMRGNAE